MFCSNVLERDQVGYVHLSLLAIFESQIETARGQRPHVDDVFKHRLSPIAVAELDRAAPNGVSAPNCR